MIHRSGRIVTEPIEVPDDLAEARAMREEAREEKNEAITKGFAITQLTSWLIERRKQNHFGDQLQISFIPRRDNA